MSTIQFLIPEEQTISRAVYNQPLPTVVEDCEYGGTQGQM